MVILLSSFGWQSMNVCVEEGTRIYFSFEPAYLTDVIEACYSGNLRENKQSFCRSFRTVT
jgi:hypothetical protein